MPLASRIAVAVLALVSIVLLVFGVSDIVIGATGDPGIAIAVSGQAPDVVATTEPVGYRLFDFATRQAGLGLAFLGLLLAVLVLVPYRRGERWAWRTLWALPAWALAVPGLYVGFGLAPGAPPAPPMLSGPAVAAVTAAALLVDRRRFGRGA